MADGNAAELVLQSLKTHIMVKGKFSVVTNDVILFSLQEVGVVKYAFAALSSMAESEGKLNYM